MNDVLVILITFHISHQSYCQTEHNELDILSANRNLTIDISIFPLVIFFDCRHKNGIRKTRDASSLSSATHARGGEEEAKDNDSSWHREKTGSRKRSPRRGKATAESAANREEARYEREVRFLMWCFSCIICIHYVHAFGAWMYQVIMWE